MNNEHAVPPGGNPAALRTDHLAVPGRDVTTRDADPGACPPNKTLAMIEQAMVLSGEPGRKP